MARIDHAAIAERANEQLGLLTSGQLQVIGVTRRQVDRLIAQGLLRRAGARRGRPDGRSGPARQRLLAATLSVGGSAVASHLAAAWLWGFDGIEPTGIVLSVPRSRGAAIDGATIHRVRGLQPVDTTRLGPQPVATPARTLIDIAPVVSRARLEGALEGACRRGQVHMAFLRWRLDLLRRSGRPGLSVLAELVELDHRDRAESSLESAFLRLLREHFLPMPRLQVSMHPGGGARVRLDALYEDQRLVVEVGGHATHATRRQRQVDAERRARLVAAGLRVVDFTYEDVVERPRYVVATIARLLGLEPFCLDASRPLSAPNASGRGRAHTPSTANGDGPR